MSQTTKANTINDVLRALSTTLFDKPAYWLLGIMYQIFFNVATADLFNSATILNFYKRVQLIIGVFMIFQLAIIILKGIMNPDQVTDSKSGVGVFIKKVIIALVLLTLMTPISIPNPTNDYQRQINNNGLLFGTLYSLQYRILSNNTLGRLILGTDTKGVTTDDATADDDLSGTDKQAAMLQRSSNIFTATILKGFVRINLHPDWEQPKDGSAPETKNKNRMCTDISDKDLAAYTKLDANPSDVLDLVNVKCVPEEDASWLPGIIGEAADKAAGKQRYAFAYTPILSAIAGFGFAFILISYTVSIAIRSIKLVVLRLLAPIPIIGYMDPKGGKDSAFNAWVKMTTSTYLDLFIRLAIIYFVIFLIQDMIINGIVINTGTGIIGALSFIFICVGLFAFGKEAPKFIREAIGLKGDGPGLFTGFGQLMGAGAALSSVTSGAASAVAARKLSDAAHGKNNNLFKNIGSGIAGAISGGKAGIKGAYSAKDAAGMKEASLAASRKHDQEAMNNALEGSTWLGRKRSALSSALLGDTKAMKADRELAVSKKYQDLFKSLDQELENDKTVKDQHGLTAKAYKEKYDWAKQHGTVAQIRTAKAQLEAAKDRVLQAGSNTTVNEIQNNMRTMAKGNDYLLDGVADPTLSTYDSLGASNGNAIGKTTHYQSAGGMVTYRAGKADDAGAGVAQGKK